MAVACDTAQTEAACDIADVPTPRAGLSPAVILLFAIACGLSVANIYCAQPLLDTMARDFDIAPASIGSVVTMTQIGYGLGLIFIVPLGDLFDRRKLIAGQAALSAVALAFVGFAPTFFIFVISLAIVGLLAVVIQILVAFAATLACSAERGKAIGTVTSGIVIGILLARFVSGSIADFGGWRSVYGASALLTLGMAVILYFVLPDDRQKAVTSYRDLLHSVLRLFVEEPVLRIRAIFALLIFAAFSTFWTAIVLPLSAPPFSLSHMQIGLLGLAGIAGALAASRAGRLADHGFGSAVTGSALTLMLFAWGLIALLPFSLWALVAGVIILDLAIQAVHVTNQSLILALRPEAGSRLVGGYMVFYSLGSAAGSLATTQIYAQAGWTGVCLLGAAISVSALLLWLLTMRRFR